MPAAEEGRTEKDERREFLELSPRVRAAKGTAQGIRKILRSSCVPMVLIDNDRRHTDANAAARLLLRRSLDELRHVRTDDLVPAQRTSDLARMWDTLIAHGMVAGELKLRLPDGPFMTVAYCGAANMLPGSHLFVFLPASWPEDELGGFIDEHPPEASGELTERQREVLKQISHGADISAIAEEFSVSSHTVKTHLRNAMRRLGARNRAQAIALALRSGAIS